jgi:hypothetical protein
MKNQRGLRKFTEKPLKTGCVPHDETDRWTFVVVDAYPGWTKKDIKNIFHHPAEDGKTG